MPLEYLFVILVTTFIECCVAYLFRYRKLRELQAFFLANLLTVTPFSYVIWLNYIDTFSLLIIGQICVSATEAAALLFALRTKKRKRLLATVALMNAVTFAASAAYFQLPI